MVPFGTFLQGIHMKVIRGATELSHSKHLDEGEGLFHHLYCSISKLEGEISLS